MLFSNRLEYYTWFVLRFKNTLTITVLYLEHCPLEGHGDNTEAATAKRRVRVTLIDSSLKSLKSITKGIIISHSANVAIPFSVLIFYNQ